MTTETECPATRLERDPLGELEVPPMPTTASRPQRAIRNFPISGRLPDIGLVRAAVQVKKAAARANHATGRLPDHLAAAIVQAADEILGLRSDPSGTPGEALRSRRCSSTTSASTPSRPAPACQPQHEHQRGARQPRHRDPGRAGRRQRASAATTRSSAPTTTSTWPSRPTTSSRRRCASPRSTEGARLRCPSLDELAEAFDERAAAFDDVLKSGRTHMQDAVPIRLGQEFAAYALTVRRARGAHRCRRPTGSLEQNIGATAVGTGLNAEPEYISSWSSNLLSEQTGYRPAHRRAPGPGDPVDGARCWTSRRRCAASRSTWPRSWRTCC